MIHVSMCRVLIRNINTMNDQSFKVSTLMKENNGNFLSANHSLLIKTAANRILLHHSEIRASIIVKTLGEMHERHYWCKVLTSSFFITIEHLNGKISSSVLNDKILNVTRMYSSRMRTARLLMYPGGGGGSA